MVKDYNKLTENAQRVFVIIEEILDRYMTDKMHIPKTELMWESNMSRTPFKNALRELKVERYIVTDDVNSATIYISRECRIGGINGDDELS